MNEFEDDELDIELQDLDDIGARLILLFALVLWPTLDANERMQWFTWMKAQDVLGVATEWEIDKLRSPTDDAIDISREAAEAMIPLAWASGLLGELPPRSGQDVLESLLASLPTPEERVESFLDGLVLVEESDVALERERAEIWRWRTTAEVLKRDSHGVERVEVVEAIREVVLESAMVGVMPDNDGNDFLVDGVPVGGLDTEALHQALLETDERLRAMNWVCGLTEWDQIEVTD